MVDQHLDTIVIANPREERVIGDRRDAGGHAADKADRQRRFEDRHVAATEHLRSRKCRRFSGKHGDGCSGHHPDEVRDEHSVCIVERA